MKIKRRFIIREIMDDVILVPIGSGDEKFNGLVTTNEVGAFIWKKLCVSRNEDEILADILDTYDVDKDVASSDLKEFLSKLMDNGIIEADDK